MLLCMNVWCIVMLCRFVVWKQLYYWLGLGYLSVWVVWQSFMLKWCGFLLVGSSGFCGMVMVLQLKFVNSECFGCDDDFIIRWYDVQLFLFGLWNRVRLCILVVESGVCLCRKLLKWEVNGVNLLFWKYVFSVLFNVLMRCLGLCIVLVLNCFVNVWFRLVLVILCCRLCVEWLFILFGLNNGLWICLGMEFVWLLVKKLLNGDGKFVLLFWKKQ